MELVSDIINELMDINTPVAAPLLKTKVLASRLKSVELQQWVEGELNGYRSNNTLPKYRRFKADIRGTFINGNYQHKNAAIPIPTSDEKMSALICTLSLKDSIATLETMSKGKTEGTITFSFPQEILSWWQSQLEEENPYLQIQTVYQSVSIGAVIETINSVRNKLLDFMLKIDAEYGGITEIKSLQNKQKEIAQIMNQTIINNTGDGNIVNTGNEAKIDANIQITKGDRNALSEKLLSSGVDKKEVAELLTIVDTETPNGGSFGTKVGGWMKKMLGKAVDGSWQVGLGAAGNLLSEALKGYYGMQ